ncbi:MAG TPA: HD domain-containing phosphohydrolase [Candidatus Dormibacteraeota bacterium]|nr:HD domain-containing phosphohydrolase [Candidatus Dormibacteraeota bacterium]
MDAIVLVDDNSANLVVYQRVIDRLEDSKTVCFERSEKALQWSFEHDVDLAVVDYRMPPPDGLQFIREFHAMPGKANVPVIMLTGERDVAVRRKALDLGANDFLNKPVDPVEFLARCRNLLSLRRSQQMLADRAAQLAHEVGLATKTIRERELETIVRLARIAELRDSDTGKHIARMGEFCRVIADRCGLPGDEVELIKLASPMHDIGKIGIPDNILLKPAKLTPEEFDVMRRHTVIGHEMLSDSTSPMLRRAAEISRWHHERHDGTGYPDGLKGEQIPVAARICAVSDVFDALTSKRPYKEPWPVDRAVGEVRRLEGAQFDPAVVRAFLDGLEEIMSIKQILAG